MAVAENRFRFGAQIESVEAGDRLVMRPLHGRQRMEAGARSGTHGYPRCSPTQTPMCTETGKTGCPCTLDYQRRQ